MVIKQLSISHAIQVHLKNCWQIVAKKMTNLVFKYTGYF